MRPLKPVVATNTRLSFKAAYRSKTMRVRLIASACSIVAALLTTATAVRVQELLVPDVPVERDLAARQTHTYQLALGGEQCVRIAVDQRGIDVAVAVRDRGGQPLAEDNRLGSRGTELLPGTKPGPGAYGLAVSATEAARAGERNERRVTTSESPDTRASH